jgi:hypothetical protein
VAKSKPGESKGDKEEKLNKDLREADMEEEDEEKIGMEIEKEHDDLTGGDKKKIKMIVDAHLKEDKKYYSKLKEMEEED